MYIYICHFPFQNQQLIYIFYFFPFFQLASQSHTAMNLSHNAKVLETSLFIMLMTHILLRHTLFEQIPSMYLADTWNAPLLTSDKPRCVCLPNHGSCLADGRLIC
ncbi:hypothetical protein FKM82_019426 [Ascaphus truei]